MTLGENHIDWCHVNGKCKCHHHNHSGTVLLVIHLELGAIPHFGGAHLHQGLSGPFLSFPTSVNHCTANPHIIVC